MELKSIRESKGLTQLQLSEKIGRDRSLIAKIEGGDAFPSVSTAKAIGRELEVDWTIFFNQVGEKDSRKTKNNNK